MSIERQIDLRREELVQKIEGLRASTMKHAHVGRSGGLKIDNSEPLAKLNTQITEVEAQIAAVDAVVSEMGQLYRDAGVESFQRLNTLGKNAHDIVSSAAPRAWLAFQLCRGQGQVVGKDRTSWLVSDIISLDEYKQQEDQIRKERDKAKEKEDSLRQTRDRLLVLFKSIEVESTADDFAS